MKRFISVLLVALLLICTVATAEAPDYASMTDEELKEIQSAVRNELVRRELVASADTVLIDQDGFTMYLTGENEVSNSGYLNLGVIAINDSDRNVGVNITQATINGWDVGGAGIHEVSAGNKQQASLQFSLSKANISTIDEIEDMDLEFKLFDVDESVIFSDAISVTLTFPVG